MTLLNVGEDEVEQTIEQGKNELIVNLENEIDEMRSALYDSQTDIRVLTLAIKMLKEFIVAKGFDPASVGDTLVAGEKVLEKKIQDLTKAELKERNEFATARQAGRHATAPDKLKQPTYEEMSKMYEEKLEKINPAFQMLVDAMIAQDRSTGKPLMFTPEISPELKKLTDSTEK
jgi:hypothetical protein